MNYRWLRWALLLALFAVPATGQESPKLTLLKRDIDIRVSENLVIARITLKVKNPHGQFMEGAAFLEAPAGAAVCEATLEKNIAAAERRSKLLDPELAASLYEGVRNGKPSRDEDAMIDLFMRANGVGATRPGEPEDPTATAIRMAMRNWRATNSTPNGRPTRPKDPALLEWTHGDSYRLRFFPVFPWDDQTVSFVYAWEAARDGAEWKIVLPLPVNMQMNVDPQARDSIRVSIESQGRVALKDSSHQLVAREATPETHRFASAIGGAKESEFRLAYALDREESRPIDFTQEVAWSKVNPAPGREFGFAQAERAVLAKRAIDQLVASGSDADLVKVAEISRLGTVVSRKASLLVIEWRVARQVQRDLARRQAEQAAKSPARREEKKAKPDPVAIAPREGADLCDVMRGHLGMKSQLHQYPCAEYICTTNDPARIAWARAKGLLWGYSTNSLCWSYLHVKHSKYCPLTEEDPAKLALIAEAMDRK